jgi:hypothetical protein
MLTDHSHYNVNVNNDDNDNDNDYNYSAPDCSWRQTRSVRPMLINKPLSLFSSFG